MNWRDKDSTRRHIALEIGDRRVTVEAYNADIGSSLYVDLDIQSVSEMAMVLDDMARDLASAADELVISRAGQIELLRMEVSELRRRLAELEA